jgi:NAD(P)-dependent dehydrogenase (short-subunit alcohol dehydrogenase family)
MQQAICAVVGAGPGIGLAVARRFARQGMRVALLARRPQALDGYVAGYVQAGSRFDPDRIADAYWKLHAQQPDAWQTEVVFR